MIRLKVHTAIITAILFFCTQAIFAQQRVSLTANIRAFGIDKVSSSDNSDVSYKGTTSFSGNLKLYTKNQFAFRLGLGLDNLNYEFAGDSLSTNYDAVRKQMTAYLGLEKHFGKSLLRPYLGVFVPLTFNAEDTFTDITHDIGDQFDGESMKAGFSMLAGLNLAILKFLRVGVEFNAGFSSFKSEVLDPLIDDPAGIKFKNLDYSTQFVVGVAF